MEEEIFKDIPWYEWLYQISSLWRVKSLNYQKTKQEKILKTLFCNWYGRVRLPISINKKISLVHRLVAQAFIPNPENKPQVNHINWIKSDNRVDNLEWVTISENAIHNHKILWYKTYYSYNHPTKWKKLLNPCFTKKVNQYDLEWNFIKTWNSIINIKRELNINNSDIWECCKWRRKTAWWFIWKYNDTTTT